MRVSIVAALVLIAVAAGAVIAAQAPAPAPGPTAPIPGPTAPAPGPGMGRMGPPADPGQMIDMLGDRLGLTEAEKAATKQAVRAKMEAAAPLTQELRALGEVARNEQATDEEVIAALQRFDAALATYRQKVKAIDGQLIQAVSPKARAAMTALGVIDNGMGLRFGGRMMPGGRGMGGPGAGGMREPGARRWGGSGSGEQGPQVIR